MIDPEELVENLGLYAPAAIPEVAQELDVEGGSSASMSDPPLSEQPRYQGSSVFLWFLCFWICMSLLGLWTVIVR